MHSTIILLLSMGFSVITVLAALRRVKKVYAHEEILRVSQHALLSWINYLPGFFLGPLFFEYTWRFFIGQEQALVGSSIGFGLGLIVLAGSLYMYVDTLCYMGRFWTTGVALFSGHRVLKEHCFAIIRHPIYVAWFLMFIAYWSMTGDVRFGISLGCVFGWYLFRSILEERFLILHLPGYRSYQKSTWRFIPFVF